MGLSSIFGFSLYNGPSYHWHRIECSCCHGKGCSFCDGEGWIEVTQDEYIRYLEEQQEKINAIL